MCGIAGIVQDEPSSGSTTDWLAVIACLQALGNSSICVASPDSLEDKVSVAESQTFPLREYQQIRSLMELEDVQRQLSDVSQGLVRFDQDLLTAVNAPEAALSIEAMERWNSLSIRIRDLAWLIERDVLQYIPRLRSLIVPEFEANPKAWFKAWKLAVTLENIGRMEVRGRDSLGISLMVNFPTQESYRNWISNTQGRFAEELEKRRDAIEFVNQAIIQDDDTESPGLVFVYKVAQEVGALGDNVAAIYQSISQDALAWSALMVPQVTTNIFSHTRWASHGVISEPNCHPVNEVTLKDGACAIAQSPHRVVVCLNGDVDNYQDLIHRFASQEARFVPGRVSTDTKIIPMLVDYYFRQSNDMREAFCKAVSDCEGSIAIIMQNTHEPHKTYLALRGSGQALFVGLCQGGYIFASELYGVVEQTTKFVRMDGTTERVAGRPETAGQVFVLDTAKRGVEGIEVYSFDGASLGSEVLKVHSAEITTRDINRGSFSHFLLKEISEAPESIRKTIRGKFFLSRVDDQLKVRMNLDERVIPKRVLELLQQGQLRRVYLIGQGTAAVAGQAVSVIMQKMLGGAITVQALKATELSGYSMDKDLSDALVIAISQSGTTTDTNRTIDMAKSRGATVIGIVNRRNSDLVYKVDGVLYTSDGRDIEMSVASTKAFYSQVVAGYLVTYQLALALGTYSENDIYHELSEIVRLPELMKSVLANQDPIRKLAEQWAPTRRDWAIVGSGPTRAAADEIRIKLSELCYKSIATDFIEDKKHIDLSSEPLTLICVAGLPIMALKDAVKEVAIFKSHKSIPIVICSEGFNSFESYAAGVLYVPKTSEAASVLLNTLVGHLWGYYCALAIDRGAEQLRRARALAVQAASSGQSVALTPAFMRQVREIAAHFRDDLTKGRLNSSLSVEVGAQLSGLFNYFTGGASLRQFAKEFQEQATPENVAEVLIGTLTSAITELSRPIDAIKHQAKTVTVGISRLEEHFDGPLFEALEKVEIAPDSIPYGSMVELRAISQALSEVSGITCYTVQGLGTLGEISKATTIKTISKLGDSANMRSRADAGTTLVGSKEWAVRHYSSYRGRGKDRKPFVVIPSAPRGQVEKLVLLHLRFDDNLSVEKRVSLLRDISGRYDDIKSNVLESDTPWTDEVLAQIPVADLVTLPLHELSRTVIDSLSRPS